MAAGGGIHVGTGILDIKLQFPELGKAAKGVGEAIGRAGQGIGKGLADSLKGAAPAIKGVGEALGKAGQGVGAGVGSGLRGAAPAITGVGKALGQASKGFGSGLGSAIKGTAAPINAIGSSLGRAASGFGNALKSTMQGVGSLVKSVGDVLAAPFKMLGGGLGGGGLMALFGGGAVAGGFGSVIKAAGDMESSLNDIRRVTGFTSDQMETLKGRLVEIATNGKLAGASLDDIFKAAEMGGRLGLAEKGGVEGLERFVRGVVKMKVAISDMPVEETATGIAQILNLFGRGSEDTLRMASALNKMDLSSTATARDLLDITQRFKGVGEVIGLTIPQVLALSAVLKDAGISNEVAGSSMNQIFKNLLVRYRDFARVAKVNPVDFRQMVVGDPIKALGAVIDKIKEMKDPIAQLQAIGGLGLKGVRTGSAMAQLLKTFDQLGPRVAQANKEWDTMASIEDAVALKSKELWSQLTLLWNQVQVTAAAFGLRLLPVVKALAQGFKMLTEDVGAFLDENKGAIEAWAKEATKWARTVGVAFTHFWDVVKLVSEVALEKWEQLSTITRRLGEQIWFNLSFGMHSAIKLIKNTMGALGEFLGDLFKQIGENMVANLMKAITNFSGNPISRAFAKMFDKIIPGTLDAFDELAKEAKDKAAKIDVPPIVPRVDLFDRKRILAGVNAPPGIDARALFGGLPNRADKINPILKGLNDEFLKRQQAAAARDKLAEDRDKQAQAGARLNAAGAAAGRIQAGAMGRRKLTPRQQATMDFLAQRRRANRMLGGPAAAAAARRRLARDAKVRARKMRAAAGQAAGAMQGAAKKAGVDVAAGGIDEDALNQAKAIGNAFAFALKDNEIGKEMLKLLQRIANNGVAGVFG